MSTNKFIAPKNGGFVQLQRIPRKLKRKYSKILNQYSFLTIEQRLWYLKTVINPEYCQFLIQNLITNGKN